MMTKLRLKIAGAFAGICYVVFGNSLCYAADTSCDVEAVITKAISGDPVLDWDGAQRNPLNQLIATAAPGEFEPASVVIHNKNGLCSGVSFNIDDFKLISDSSKVISKSRVQIKYVKKWFQGGTAWTSIGNGSTRILIPELLLNNPLLVKVDTTLKSNYLLVNSSKKPEYMDISTYAQKRGRETPSTDQIDVRDESSLQKIDLSQDSQQLFLTFLAPEDAAPGKYKSTLRASRSGNDIFTLPVIFEILPFKLDAPAIEYSLFYRGILTDGVGTISSEQKSEQQYRAELTDMLNHGVSNPNVYQSIDNKSTLKKALEIRRSLGFNSPALYYLGRSASTALTDADRADLSKSAEVMRQMCQPLGYSDVYFFGTDEAKGDLLHQQLPSWQFVRTLGLKVFTTGYKGTFDSVGSQLDLFVLAGQPNPDEIAKFHAAHKRVFTYAYPQSGPENPELFRRNFGIDLWAQGVDGAMTYAYQESFAFTWNDFDHEQYRDHNFTYPTSNGVISTLAWEGFREAVDDVRYVTTLKNLIMKVKNSCKASDCQDAISASTAVFNSVNTRSSSRDLDDTRKQIITAIQRLLPFEKTVTPPSSPTDLLIVPSRS